MDGSTFLYFVIFNATLSQSGTILHKMKKKIYESPKVEQLECMVEKGFAGSNNTPTENPDGTEGLYDFEGGVFQFN